MTILEQVVNSANNTSKRNPSFTLKELSKSRSYRTWSGHTELYQALEWDEPTSALDLLYAENIQDCHKIWVLSHILNKAERVYLATKFINSSLFILTSLNCLGQDLETAVNAATDFIDNMISQTDLKNLTDIVVDETVTMHRNILYNKYTDPRMNGAVWLLLAISSLNTLILDRFNYMPDLAHEVAMCTCFARSEFYQRDDEHEWSRMLDICKRFVLYQDT